MALQIRTFSNRSGGHSLFKAIGHPLVAARARELVDALAKSGPIAVYDPAGSLPEFAQIYALTSWQITDVFVQRVEHVGRPVLGRRTRSIADLPDTTARVLFVAAFDDGTSFERVRPLVPGGVDIVFLDALRLPERMLTNPADYLDPLNFATNFALFRDGGGLHTQLRTANYWERYGARDVALWLCLLDSNGARLAEWTQPLPNSGASVVIDSMDVHRRFGLDAFAGSLFVHAQRVAGHDVIKYALDTYSDDAAVLSCTHDANAWPAERYAGLPAPRPGERVLLWVQNSHPAPIPAGGFGFCEMGKHDVAYYDEEIPAFGTRAVDVATLLPGLQWPAQVEVHAGQHFVRPRYEIVEDGGRRRVAHANVERTDLRPDPAIRECREQLGKGFILPAPILPLDRWRTSALPTPMATTQESLPLQVVAYDASGREVSRSRLGVVTRGRCEPVDLDAALPRGLGSGYGHFELSYDFDEPGEVDGWLHALFRYEHRESGHAADSSFGAHIYNLPVVFRNEPQSYSGPPPGLSTRLFLRLGFGGRQAFCHLIYPASGVWRDHSSTTLTLFDGAGSAVAARELRIPRSGSQFWRCEEMFNRSERSRAGDQSYVIVRDETCRLFGYHGLLGPGGSFSVDHMFGF